MNAPYCWRTSPSIQRRRIPISLHLGTRALAPSIAVLSRCHPGCNPFKDVDPEARAGNVFMVHDYHHFAVWLELFDPVAAAVGGDLEDSVRQAVRLPFSRSDLKRRLSDA